MDAADRTRVLTGLRAGGLAVAAYALAVAARGTATCRPPRPEFLCRAKGERVRGRFVGDES